MQRFEHDTCVYGSDEEFLAMAVPFVEGALERDDPVLVATTPYNLGLLGDALGSAAGRMDYAETAHFGPRPPQRVAAFHRWWKRGPGGSGPGGSGQLRILAEPVWQGKSHRDALAWRRMESGLNAIFAGSGIWMICPYDTRSVPPEIAAESLRTHPGSVSGSQRRLSEQYVEPAEFARLCDAEPLPPVPADSAAFSFDGDTRAVRAFVAGQVDRFGLTGERAALFVLAVSEVAGHLRAAGTGRATVKVWEGPGTIMVELYEPGGRAGDPFLGFRPPALDARPGDGLWLTRQVCDHVDVRADDAGCAYRLQVPGRRFVQ